VLPFRGIGTWRNFTEAQQLGHASVSGPEVKNGRSSAKDGAPVMPRRGTNQEEANQILRRVSADAARIIHPPLYPAQIRGQEKAVTAAAKPGQPTADEPGKGHSFTRKQKQSGRRGSCERDPVSKKSREYA